MPYITLTITVLTPKILRMVLDKSKPSETKQTTMSGFKKFWLGGEYELHYK